MRVTDLSLFDDFKTNIPPNLDEKVDSLKSPNNEEKIDYAFKVSSVFSSNIEGNLLDVNSFINSEIHPSAFKRTKQHEEIKDLIRAYQFAKSNSLTEQSFLKCHGILSESFLIQDKSGTYRTDRMAVYDQNGMVYLALEPDKVEAEMKFLFSDIEILLNQHLEVSRAFYHASLIHLKIAQTHPFWDGNGRMARLVEKSFLTRCLGEHLWLLQSEQCYKERLLDYYANIHLGQDYHSLQNEDALSFLLMLPSCA